MGIFLKSYTKTNRFFHSTRVARYKKYGKDTFAWEVLQVIEDGFVRFYTKEPQFFATSTVTQETSYFGNNIIDFGSFAGSHFCMCVCVSACCGRKIFLAVLFDIFGQKLSFRQKNMMTGHLT